MKLTEPMKPDPDPDPPVIRRGVLSRLSERS